MTNGRQRLFGNGEVVRVGEKFGTIVTDLSYVDDDIFEGSRGALILLFPEYRSKGDNGLVEVPLSQLKKQYDEEITP